MLTEPTPPISVENGISFAPVPLDTLICFAVLAVPDVPPVINSPDDWNCPVSVCSLLTTNLSLSVSILTIVVVAFYVPSVTISLT